MKNAQVKNCTLDVMPGLAVVDASVKATPITSGDADSVPSSDGLTPLNDLPTQINNHHGRAVTMANSSIDYALKCGQALADAKAQLSHGEWTPWLRENCPGISPRQAQKYKRIAENWASIQAKREINPDDVASVEGTLSLIAEPIPNANSDSHLEPAPDETVLDEDSLADSDAASSGICQHAHQTGPVNAEHSAKEDAADEVPQSRVSAKPDSSAINAGRKQTAELQPSVKKTVTNHLCPSAEIIHFSVAKLKPLKIHSYVYRETTPDQELIDSIEQFGVLEPLIVASRGKWIVSGHRRWEAAKQLGMETVPVRYVSYRFPAELRQLLGECNRQRVKSAEQCARESYVRNAAVDEQRHWERRCPLKGDGEPAE